MLKNAFGNMSVTIKNYDIFSGRYSFWQYTPNKLYKYEIKILKFTVYSILIDRQIFQFVSRKIGIYC